jgi:hypothetical protein
MPIQYEYIADLKCLYAVGSGKVQRQDFLDYHHKITISEPPPSLLVLSDYRELDSSALTASDIEEIRASALSKTQNRYARVREAIVVSEGLTYGLSRMYDGVFHSDKYEVNILSDINEAKAWLGLAPEDLPQAI